MENINQTQVEAPSVDVVQDVAVAGDAEIDAIADEEPSAASGAQEQPKLTTEEHELPTREIDKRFLHRVGEEMRRYRSRRSRARRSSL